MKKIPLIFTITFLISCGNEQDNVTISKTEYKKLIGDTLTSKYPKPFTLHTDGLLLNRTGIVPASDGHEYLVINFDLTDMCVQHYIDCEKCKTQK